MFHAFFAGTYGWTSSLTCMLTRKISVNWHSYHSWSQRDNSNSAKQEMSPTILVTCEHDMQHTIRTIMMYVKDQFWNWLNAYTIYTIAPLNISNGEKQHQNISPPKAEISTRIACK